MEDLTKNGLANITMEAMDEEEKKEQKTSQKQVVSTAFNEKNYLNTKLNVEKGEKQKELRIRLLPIDKDSSTPFKTIYVHNVKVPKEVAPSGYKSYICIEKTDGVDHEKYGHKCPFCELNREAYKKSVESTDPVDKKRYQDVSLANIAREACVIRCIERGAEEDGPKFWKFNIKLDKTDPKNVIKGLYKLRLEESREDGEEENILDIHNGRDFRITIEQAESKTEGSGKDFKNKTSVKVTDCGKNKPLSNDEEKIKEWINDEKKWSDVFAVKPYEYLAVIINGGIPWFDKNEKKWVSRDEFNEATERKNSEIEAEITEKAEKLKGPTDSVINSVMINDEDEELPF